MHIRRACPQDASELARLAERTFRDTFGAANRAQDMEQHCRLSYGAPIQAGEIADPAMLTLLCADDGQLIGFVQLRWGTAPTCVEATAAGEIRRLYVDRAWHGKGVAAALMASGLRELRARGSALAWLGVWEHNPRAIAFYRKWGFAEVGDHAFQLGEDRQRDLIMVRAVDAGQD